MAGLSLEGKPWYVGLIVGLVLAAAIVWGANYAFIGDITKQIDACPQPTGIPTRTPSRTSTPGTPSPTSTGTPATPTPTETPTPTPTSTSAPV